jgi:two-component system LytT family response regulator
VSEPLRVLIVDDEPLARRLVHHLLEADAEVTVVGECSGADAAAAVARTRPDIMFLDVQMPEVDGFGVLDDIGVDRAPIVVFVTAFADHALRAFEVHAIDYLLKPINDARFAAALARAKQQARGRRRGEIDERLSALMRDRPRYPRGFLVRTRDRTLVVKAEEIDWIEAADYYVSIHVGGASHLLRETMSELERRLDPERFFRVHRSAIVNVDRVREIHPLFRGDCELALSDGTRVRLSRTRRGEFERLFSAPSDGA